MKQHETALQTVKLDPSVLSPRSPWGLTSHFGADTATAATTFSVPRLGHLQGNSTSPQQLYHRPHKPSMGPCRVTCSVPLAHQAAGEGVQNANRGTQHTHAFKHFTVLPRSWGKNETQQHLPDPTCRSPTRYSACWSFSYLPVCLRVLSHSVVSDSLQPRGLPLSMEFSWQLYWSGLPFPSPGDLPKPGFKSTSLVSPALASRFFTTGANWEAPVCLVTS